jgi:GTPase
MTAGTDPAPTAKDVFTLVTEEFIQPEDHRFPDVPADLSHGELELEERSSLRRVAGLSTELQDITEVEYRQLRLERVVLVGVWTEGSALESEASLAELARLAETAGSEVLEGLVQRRDKPDPATYIGSGKVTELGDIVTATGADTVICDGELSPSQLQQLEARLKVKVIDRTALILDIFAQHARSKEGKTQVELAQLQYLLPRLRGWGQTLSRQAGGRAGGAGGGVGLRGPGETKLETDRRRIHARIAKLRREIKAMGTVRATKRGRRVANEVPSVAIAGYTNAGKSSLLNVLTGAGVLVEDALFATLDATTRRAETNTASGIRCRSRAMARSPAASVLLTTTSSGGMAVSCFWPISPSTSRTALICHSGIGSEPSTTCTTRSASATSSSVVRNASTSWCGRCRTNPTVSVSV